MIATRVDALDERARAICAVGGTCVDDEARARVRGRVAVHHPRVVTGMGSIRAPPADRRASQKGRARR